MATNGPIVSALKGDLPQQARSLVSRRQWWSLTGALLSTHTQHAALACGFCAAENACSDDER